MTSILDECDTHSRRDALTNPGGRHTLLKEHLINTSPAFLFPLYTEKAKQTQTKNTPSVNKYIYTYISNAHPARRLHQSVAMVTIILALHHKDDQTPAGRA